MSQECLVMQALPFHTIASRCWDADTAAFVLAEHFATIQKIQQVNDQFAAFEEDAKKAGQPAAMQFAGSLVLMANADGGIGPVHVMLNAGRPALDLLPKVQAESARVFGR